MIKSKITLASIACLLGNHAGAQEQDPALMFNEVDYRLYWNANIGIVVPDDDIRLNEANVFDIRVGKHFTDNWSLEFELMRDEYDFDIDYDLKHYAAGANFIYTNHDPLWKPYFLVGLGAIYSDARYPDSIQSTDMIVNVAVGGSWYFAGNGVRLRVEARSRLDTNNSDLPGQDGFGDGQFTLGIIVPIGD